MTPTQQGRLGPMGRKTGLHERIWGAWWERAWCGLVQKIEPGPFGASTAAGDNRHKVQERKLQFALCETALALEETVQKVWEISILEVSHKRRA